MLKLAGECIEGQLAEHEASIDAHTRNLFQSFMVGSYCIGIPVRATANYAINANYLRTVPLIAARDITIDRIAIQVYSAAASGEKARLGIYKNKSDDEITDTLKNFLMLLSEMPYEELLALKRKAYQLAGSFSWQAKIENYVAAVEKVVYH